MAISAGTVVADAKMNMHGFVRDLKTMNQSGSKVTNAISNKFSRIGDQFMSIGSKLTAGLTVPLAGAGALAIKTAADYERLQVQLNTLAGSAEEGAKAFQRLQEFSAGTPFQLKDLVKANNIIVGMGRSMEEAFSDLQMLGDVASATGANINELARTFGQAAAEGKLMTRDIREFINRGIPLTKILSESMGVATDQIFDLASQGEITFDILLSALRDATSGTGLYANATESAADTIHGVWSTLTDNISRLLGEVGNTIVDTLDLKQVARGVIAEIQNIVDAFKALSEESKKRLLAVAGALAAGGPLLVSLGVAAKAVSGFVSLVTSKFSLVVGAMGIVVTSAQFLADNWTNILDVIGQQTESWAKATQNTLSFLGKAMSFFGRGMGSAMAPYFAGLDSAILQLQGLGEDASVEFTSFQDAGVNAFTNIKDAALGMFDSLSGGSLSDFMGLLDNLKSVGRETDTDIPIGMAKLPVERYKANLESMKAATTGFKTASEHALSLSATSWDDFISTSKEAGFDFVNFISGQVSNSITGFAETIGVALSGAENAFATGFEKIVQIVLDAAKQLGKILVSIGTAIAFIPGLQGPAGGLIAGGASLTALSSGFSAGIDKRIDNRRKRSRNRRQRVHVTGELKGQGSELRAVINESQYIDLN